MIKQSLMCLMLASSFSITAMGKGGHVHNHQNAVEAAPHGGTLRDAPPFKAEAVISGDTVKVYIYDSKMKPIKPQKEKMDAAIELPKKKARAFTFKKAGAYYEAKVAGIGNAYRYDLLCDLSVNGKTVTVDFGVDNVDQ